MVDQFLPTISGLVALGEFAPVTSALDNGSAGDFLASSLDGAESLGTNSSGHPSKQQQAQRAEAEWQGAVGALGQMLLQHFKLRSQSPTPHPDWQGVMLSGPFPVLNSPALTQHLSNWTFIPQPLAQLSLAFGQLMPADATPPPVKTAAARLLPLIEGDPLAAERFCLVLTSAFSLVIVLGKDVNDELHFQFSFMPQVIESVWQLLRSRILLTQPQQLDYLEPLVETFAPTAPDYRLVSQFSRYLLSALPREKDLIEARQAACTRQVEHVGPVTPTQSTRTPASFFATSSVLANGQAKPTQSSAAASPNEQLESDAALLKAMAHEIRTPLTTIRTLTRSLLRRQALDTNIQKRLQQIDRECTQQINRFNLIFKAVELESTAYKATRSPLTATSLTQLFQEAIPQWQQAATRRNLHLEVSLPAKLPMVASDPVLLQQVLTGLVELFTHSVSPSSHIHLQVMAAGHQLKLQFQSQDESTPDQSPATKCQPPSLQSLGHLLMFQPDTGGLSLNLETTKSLFQALGAKLTVRERHNQGATWTVFLPIETADYPIV